MNDPDKHVHLASLCSFVNYGTNLSQYTKGGDTRSSVSLVPLGLNSIPIRAHCSFIGRCLCYFIRP
ncbi:hypothetical protein T06_14963 [Trichinella sp. T6]|nr:hypothetical protein T06_14963 [Trichinella sp. T6]